MMAREQGPFTTFNPWPRIAWWSAAAAVFIAVVLGFLVLPRFQVNGPQLDTWTAICTALGITTHGSGPAGEPQPPVQVSSNLAWTDVTRAAIASGDPKHGNFVALNCGACHGDKGVSSQTLIPSLAGMDVAVIYKQLDDYRNDKRLWGVMNGVAKALTDKDRADVAAYLASFDGLPRYDGVAMPEAGRSLRQGDPTLRLVFAGDPQRGIPACSACHGPSGRKLGAPVLVGQHPEYIERQLFAFGQGMRRNDINRQMRVIAGKLTADEIHSIARYYGDLAGQTATAR